MFKGFHFSCQGVDVILDGEGKKWDADLYSRIDHKILRAVSKIAFNYLAYWEGSKFITGTSFNNIRSYIRLGNIPDYHLCIPTDLPVLSDEPIEGKRVIAHMITVNYAKDGLSIMAQVTLFNNMKYLVSLSHNFNGDRRKITRGHLFAPQSGCIIPLYAGRTRSILMGLLNFIRSICNKSLKVWDGMSRA